MGEMRHHHLDDTADGHLLLQMSCIQHELDRLAPDLEMQEVYRTLSSVPSAIQRQTASIRPACTIHVYQNLLGDAPRRSWPCNVRPLSQVFFDVGKERKNDACGHDQRQQ